MHTFVQDTDKQCSHGDHPNIPDRNLAVGRMMGGRHLGTCPSAMDSDCQSSNMAAGSPY